jgi:integrase
MDGQGLQLRIAADGVKTWLVRYMLDGKERQYRLPENYGDGPGRLGLKEARDAASHVRALARKGIDIQTQIANERKVELDRKLAEAAKSKTARDLFEEWVQTVDRKDKGKELRRSFSRDVFPEIGELKLSQVMPEHIEKILRQVVERGSNRIAVTLFADIKQMFFWASERRAWKTLFENPTQEVVIKKLLPKEYRGAERTRALSNEEVTELAQKLPASGLLPQSQLAIWIMLSCCCRIGELIQARWENIDLKNGVWVIPETDAKNGKAHTVALSTFAIAQFTELKRICLSSRWAFPDTFDTTHVCLKSTTKQIRDRQRAVSGAKPMRNRTKNSDTLVLTGGDWVPHDLRRTGATMMQQIGVAPAVIERILNHIEPNKLTRTYQTYDYAEHMKDAWKQLGDKLTELAPDVSIYPGYP